MPAAIRAGIDTHSCGALDTGGSDNVFIEGYPVHRLGDGDAHGGTQVQASDNVFVNGIGVARVGDMNAGEPVPPYHGGTPEGSGSPTVFVNG